MFNLNFKLVKAYPQWETRGDKTLGRQTQHPIQAHMWGDNGRQGETRPREGGHIIQRRHTCGETRGDKWRQDLGKCGETIGDKGRQNLGKADTARKKLATKNINVI